MTKPIIPEAALGQHVAVLGKTGSGKTYAAKGIVEHLLDQHRQVCTLDPTGAWWGLRLGADGKSKGYDVVLLGGAHADIPLAERSGAAVARLVTEQRASVVIDTSGFTVGEYTRWFIDFAGTLYTTIRDPLHLVIDEAHYFMPQGKSPDVDAGRMLHAGNRLMSGGRSKGIRGLLITQRPAKLHKDSLTCADTLIAMRVIAPQDRQAIKDWIDGAGDPVKGKGVLDSLAALKRGEGWVWYPEGAYLERAVFPKIGTYDSSATPKHGAAAGPKVGEIKLDEVHAAMAEAVREAEANDPKRLRARIAELEKQAKSARPGALNPFNPAATKADLAAEYQRGLEEGFVSGQASAITNLRVKADSVKAHLSRALAGIDQEFGNLHSLIAQARQTAPQARRAPATTGSPVAATRPPQALRRPSTGQHDEGNGSLSGGKRRMLIALAQYSAGLTATKLSILTGISQSGGTWRTYLGELRSTGLVQGGRDRLTITAEGIAALGTWDPLPTGQDLIDYWRRRLGESGKRAILDVLIESYPRALPQETVAERAGIAIAGGTWRTYIGELRGLELVTGRGELSASEELFS